MTKMNIYVLQWIMLCSSLSNRGRTYDDNKDNKEMELFKTSANPQRIWSRFFNNTWICGNPVNNAIQCKNDSDYIKIARCYCIYYDPNTNRSQFGSCLATCFHPQFGAYFSVKRYSVENASLFNKAMCVESSAEFQYITNRIGRFCGGCQETHGLSVYSYQMSTCIPCKEYRHRNWVKYIASSLVPLGLFYFLIVMLKINYTSSYLSGVVTAIQTIVSPLNLYILDAWMKSNTIDNTYLFKVLVSCLGLLNLDFFRGLYSPYCLNPSFSALQVISLDYINCLFPFVLIIFTYFLIKLYDRHFTPIVWLWKPFKCLLNRYYKELSLHTSLVEVFASFILLSSVKTVSVSLLLLLPVTVYNEHGNCSRFSYLYFDSNIEWLGKEHLPYALLALITSILFVFFPLLLMLLYPCRCFQKTLNRLGLNSPILRVFMDAFQGCYRLEPYDMRFFSAYYIFLRVFILFLTATIHSIFAFSATTLCLVLNAVLVNFIQPCRSPTHNKMDGLAMSMLAFFYVSLLAMLTTFYLDIYWLTPSNISFYSSIFIIISFFTIVFTWTMFRHKLRKLYQKLQSCLRKWKYGHAVDQEDSLQSFSERSAIFSSRRVEVY